MDHPPSRPVIPPPQMPSLGACMALKMLLPPHQPPPSLFPPPRQKQPQPWGAGMLRLDRSREGFSRKSPSRSEMATGRARAGRGMHRDGDPPSLLTMGVPGEEGDPPPPIQGSNDPKGKAAEGALTLRVEERVGYRMEHPCGETPRTRQD